MTDNAPEPEHIVINLPVNTETMNILETLSTDEVAECADHALESLSKEELITLIRESAVIPVQFPPPRCVDCGPDGQSVSWDYINKDWSLLCAMCEAIIPAPSLCRFL